MALSRSEKGECGFTRLTEGANAFRFFSLHSSARSWVCRLFLCVEKYRKSNEIFYGELKYLNYGFTRIVFCFDSGRFEFMKCVAVHAPKTRRYSFSSP